MQTTTNRLVKAGAILFVLWGLLHIVIGATGVERYITQGPLGMVSFGAIVRPTELTPALELAAHYELGYSILLAGYGVLAIWGAVLIWRGQKLGFWLNTIMLGIADGAFVYTILLPGLIPFSQGFLGPALYVLAIISTAVGFYGARTLHSVPAAKTSWNSPDPSEERREQTR